MQVYIEREDKIVEVEADNVKELLEKLKINPTTVLITKNNTLVTEKSILSNKDKIKIIPVISGGWTS